MEFLCVESNGQAETGSRLLLPREVTPFKPLKMLIYETEPLETSSAARHVRRANDMRGITVTVIGQGIDHKGFDSYTAAVSGTCVMLTLTLHFSVCHHLILTLFTMRFSPHFTHTHSSQALETLPQDSLVVLSDSRDVITNIHQAKFHNQNYLQLV